MVRNAVEKLLNSDNFESYVGALGFLIVMSLFFGGFGFLLYDPKVVYEKADVKEKIVTHWPNSGTRKEVTLKLKCGSLYTVRVDSNVFDDLKAGQTVDIRLERSQSGGHVTYSPVIVKREFVEGFHDTEKLENVFDES